MCYPAYPTKSSKVTQNVFLPIVALHEDIVKLYNMFQAISLLKKSERS